MMTVREFEDKLLLIHPWGEDSEAVLVFNFSQDPSPVTIPITEGRWHRRLDSAEERWQGKGSIIPKQLDSKGQVTLTLSPWAFALFLKEI